jgi:lipopolysaccharide/colanic/teichoic acid biosynthesis glycosyltransferase
MKRVFDIIASLFGLLVLSPVFILISLLIRLDSKGPILYRGRRMGRGGKEFTIYKFRTMYEKPESYSGLRLTTKGDSRVTAFGRWLRDTKLNEFPQLWNVLKGNMSMVGPRPEDIDIFANWEENIRMEILSIRPGMTSPASIIYRDEEQILDEMSAMDLYLKQILPDKLRLDQIYVHNHSILGDLDIIFMTIVLLFPQMRKVKLQEKALFSGPLSNFVDRYLTWFMADFIVALIAIGISGLTWRLTGPLNLGIIQSFILAIIIALSLSSINRLIGLGQISWRNASLNYIVDLAFSSLIMILILIGINSYFLDKYSIPIGMLINFGFLTFFGMVIIRYRERLLIIMANRWMAFRGNVTRMGDRVMVIGAGNSGQLTVWLLQKSIFFHAFSIVGFVDDDIEKLSHKVSGYPVLGTTQDIVAVVERKKIGIIFIAISKCPLADRNRILRECKKTPARVAIIPDLNDVLERSILESGLQVVK